MSQVAQCLFQVFIRGKLNLLLNVFALKGEHFYGVKHGRFGQNESFLIWAGKCGMLKSKIVHLLHFSILQHKPCPLWITHLICEKKLRELTFAENLEGKNELVWIYQKRKGYKIPANIVEVFTHLIKKTHILFCHLLWGIWGCSENLFCDNKACFQHLINKVKLM